MFRKNGIGLGMWSINCSGATRGDLTCVHCFRLNEWAADVVAPPGTHSDAGSLREWLTRFGLRVGDALQAGDGTEGASAVQRPEMP